MKIPVMENANFPTKNFNNSFSHYLLLIYSFHTHAAHNQAQKYSSLIDKTSSQQNFLTSPDSWAQKPERKSWKLIFIASLFAAHEAGRH